MDASRLAPVPFEALNRDRQIQDAKDMYQAVVRNAERSNSAVPPYDFLELIGKGSFGRVYKCKKQGTGELVAVKILDIDEADFHEHVLDRDSTITNFRKEVSILQQLKDSKARNINIIHDAFDLHNQLWIVCDYCTGGSLRTLLRANPPSRRGFEEQYIIPIARELALAIKSVHDIGVIHRDIKCANVYVNEEGHVQLGDFGIVGVLDDGSSKRRTIVGTPHYFPIEMHTATSHVTDVAYGTEIDIWAYGITIFEAVTGLPPYHNVPPNELAKAIANAPRLEGGDYSEGLRDFVAFCLNSDPKERPSADAVLAHPYIADSDAAYPTRSLVRLIERYAAWEYKGGQRVSLWFSGGAAAPASPGEYDAKDGHEDADDWNFSTSDSFNAEFGRRYSQMVASQDFADSHFDGHSGPGLPPLITKDLTPFEQVEQQFRELSASRGERSLDRLFNPDTDPYELHTPVDEPMSIMSDLPLRNMAGAAPTRESLIDLDSAGVESDGPAVGFDFSDMPTLKAKTSHQGVRDDEDEEVGGDQESYQSDDKDERRATMEWKFPAQEEKRATMDWTFLTAEPAEPDEPESFVNLSPTSSDDQSSGFRPTLKHTATEPVGQFGDFLHPVQANMPIASSPVRDSMKSMIDLDMGLAGVPDPEDIIRPSTAGSTMTDMSSGNPFHLEDDSEPEKADDRRFSYHKQWQSEGGPPKRRSHKTMQMHSRGNSLAHADSEFDRVDRSTDEEDLVYRFDPSMLADSTRPPIGQDVAQLDTNQWPDFGPSSGFDEVPQYSSASSRNNDLEEALRQERLETNGYSAQPFPGFRDPNAGREMQREIEFPQLIAPHPDALLEEASVDLRVAELDRLLDDLGATLKVTSRALREHAGVQRGERQQYSETDSGFDSSAAPTGDEDGF